MFTALITEGSHKPADISKPQRGEYNPFFQGYIDHVPEGDFMTVLLKNASHIIDVFSNIPEAKHDHAYAPGKWSIKQVLLHIIDAERVMAYRLLVALRGDTATRLDSFDENSYADHADVTDRNLEDLLAEFSAVRFNSVKLLEGLSEKRSLHQVKVAGHGTTVRALAYIIIGHAMHHVHVMRERYL